MLEISSIRLFVFLLILSPIHDNGLIFIGHVHKSSQYGRIIAQGSFDRLSHGEEDPKGHMRATRKTDGTHDIVFIENKKAKKYITISCLYLPIEDAISKIDKDEAFKTGAGVLTIENPVRRADGRAVPLEEIKKIFQYLFFKERWNFQWKKMKF